MTSLSPELEATILLGVMAIIATIVSPILWGRGRIEFLSQNVWQVDQTGGVQGLTVKVYHGEKLVNGPVYVMLGGFTNTGRRDITRDHFVTPIKIAVPPGVEIISAQVSTPDQVGAVCEVSDNEVLLTWDMLKRNERVSLYVIVSTQGPRPVELASVPRLRDIRTARPTGSGPSTRVASRLS